MSHLKKKRSDRPKVAYRPLAIAALIAGGTFQLVSPAFAVAVSGPGGLDIVNRATATYNDGITGNPDYNATSNTITLRVQEVAGIEIAASTPSATAPKPGDTLYVEFTITNAGFDPTQFFIPDTATLSDSTNFVINGPLTVMSVNGVAQNGTTGITVPPGGGATGNTAKFTFTGAGAGGSIPVGGTVVVRVPIQVLGSANTGNTLRVSLGDTAPVDTNNLVVTTPGVKDVYTVDNPDGVAGEYTGTPVDTREAMATTNTTTQLITVAARYQAFAAVLKAVGTSSIAPYDNNGTPNLLSDDKLTYSLALKVDNPNPSPSTSLAPSDLYGTAISVDSASVNRVLVSDAVPTGTQLGATSDIVAPSTSWQIVYTTDPIATKTALAAAWTTTRPTTGVITRVGFVYNTDATTATPAGNGPISKGAAGTGTTISGFSFKVNPLATFMGGQIANLAQVFGQSQPGTSAANTATQIVYDESGDKDTNNALVGTDPVAATDAAGGINDGLADPAKDGTDPGVGTDPTAAGTNTGTDPTTGDILGGEDTVYTIAAAPFTGPNGTPQAANPDLVTDPNRNLDYTNQSIVLPVGLDSASPLDNAQTPDLVFTNSLQNVSTAPQTIALRPSLPATFGATEAALPIGSTVTIDPDGAAGPAPAVVFTLTATGFTSPGGVVPTVTVGTGAASTQNYTVTVNPSSGVQTTGYPVLINAFIDGNGDGLAGATEPSNQTTNSYYTGYVKLLKDAQIMDPTNTTVIEPWTIDATKLGAAAQPTRIVKYRIQYQNISVGNAPAASGNKSLSANTLTILEDGADGTNTWFASTTDNLAPVVSGNGSLVSPTGSTVTLTKALNGTVTNDIQVYTVNVGDIAPGAAIGEVVFDRKIKQ
jgi:hypothetical protein